MIRRGMLVSALVLACFSALIVHAAGSLQSPEQFLGMAVDERSDDTLAGDGEEARPNMNSSKRSCWPHGGRQLSSW